MSPIAEGSGVKSQPLFIWGGKLFAACVLYVPYSTGQ